MSEEKDLMVKGEEIIEPVHELFKDLHTLPVHKLFKAYQSQYLLTKIVKKQAERLKSTIVNESDMFRACNLGYEGMKQLKDDVNDNIANLSQDISLKQYKDIIIPLGNFIISHKVLKNYCNDYLDIDKLNEAKIYYADMKEKIATLDDDIIEEEYIPSLLKDYGVMPDITRRTPSLIFNVEGKPILNIEQFTLREAIKDYEARYKNKNAFWRGAKTQPFIRFLQKKGYM